MAQFAIELSTQWLPRVLSLPFFFPAGDTSPSMNLSIQHSPSPLSLRPPRPHHPSNTPGIHPIIGTSTPWSRITTPPPTILQIQPTHLANRIPAFRSPQNPSHHKIPKTFPTQLPPPIFFIANSQILIPYDSPQDHTSDLLCSRHKIRNCRALSLDLFTYKELEYPINYSLTLNPSSISRNDQDMLLAFKIHTYFRNAPSISFRPRSILTPESPTQPSTTIDPTHKIPLLRKHLIDTTSQIKAFVKNGKMSRERAKSSWIRGAGGCEAVVGGVTIHSR